MHYRVHGRKQDKRGRIKIRYDMLVVIILTVKIVSELLTAGQDTLIVKGIKHLSLTKLNELFKNISWMLPMIDGF